MKHCIRCDEVVEKLDKKTGNCNKCSIEELEDNFLFDIAEVQNE